MVQKKTARIGESFDFIKNVFYVCASNNKMETQIQFNCTVPGLNGPDGLMRAHFRTHKLQKNKYIKIILSQTRNRHKGPVLIVYTRYLPILMDWDNHGASFKHIGDALKDTKVIIDDKPSIVTELQLKQVKIKTGEPSFCRVAIFDV